MVRVEEDFPELIRFSRKETDSDHSDWDLQVTINEESAGVFRADGCFVLCGFWSVPLRLFYFMPKRKSVFRNVCLERRFFRKLVSAEVLAYYLLGEVIFVVIDALPNHWVSEEWTPNLWALLKSGGWNPSGGRAVLSTATYLIMRLLLRQRPVIAWDSSIGYGMVHNSSFLKIGPQGTPCFWLLIDPEFRVPSLLVTTNLSDDGANEADVCWPPDGERQDVELDEFRYAADTSVLDAVDSIGLMSLILGLFTSMNRTPLSLVRPRRNGDERKNSPD